MTLQKIISTIDPFFDFSKTKLVRHIDNKINFRELIKKDLLEEYQSYQGKQVFHDCDYIISLFADGGSRSILFGIYKVNNKPDIQISYRNNCSKDLAIYDLESGADKLLYKYDLQKIDIFDELSQRLVIDWGKAAISWHQWAKKDKEVIEILPKGYIKEFPGFLDFILDYDELKAMINNPEANKTWHQMLASVYAIYLITDRSTGQQYVGSAYGEKEGLLGRWKNYASSGHGGNKLLKELVDVDPNYAINFSFTILRTLPKSLTNQEVVEKENLYKNKLGSKTFGLNAN